MSCSAVENYMFFWMLKIYLVKNRSAKNVIKSNKKVKRKTHTYILNENI